MRFIYHYKYYVIFFMCFYSILWVSFILKVDLKFVKHCNKNDKIKLIAIWVLYGLFWAKPYGYAHIGRKWDQCGHTHVGVPRTVPDGSHITALLEKIRIHMYISISNLISSWYVITLISTTIILSKTVIDQTPTLPHETHMGHMW